jgi:hypothetical protein
MGSGRSRKAPPNAAAAALDRGLRLERRHRWIPGLRLVRLKPARPAQVVNVQQVRKGLVAEPDP